MFAYTVRCTFTTSDVAKEWIEWLRTEHLRDVCDAGARDAEVVVIDPSESSANTMTVEVRYHFVSREAFARYERDHAPRLRSEGLKRFPPERGLTYARTTGEVVAHYRREV
ncbi:MAG TPA: DUF4286 family protein [Phycisphaerales bacterium]|nr:DUF4286 family protein [Phycisphaerales bacterium]HRQ74883.1 DUF4286 family protein [Phycisphaerales bacterium]